MIDLPPHTNRGRPRSKLHITPKDVSSARRVYWWLFLAPVASVPVWLCSAIFSSNSSGATDAFGMALISTGFSLIFYLPIFFWTFSNNPFLQAHARQAVILLILRFTSALFFTYFLFLNLFGGTQDWIFILPVINVVLWFFGFLIGWNQAGNGSTWLGNLDAEIAPTAPPPLPATAQSYQEAIDAYLHTFRTGTPAERQAVVFRLAAIGQVEIF